MKHKCKIYAMITIIFLAIILPSCTNVEDNTADSAQNGYINTGSAMASEDANQTENGQSQIIQTDDEQNNPIQVEDNIIATNPQPACAIYIKIKVNSLNVRSGPGTDYSVLAQFNAGDMVGYFGKADDWYITKVKGKTAYVWANENYTELVELDCGSDSIEAVISVALNYLGTPYVYGATRYHNGAGVLLSGFSDNAFDCSSYMQYSFYIGANVLLGLTTRNQVLQGEHVDYADISRGDLLFFTNSSRYNNTGLDRIGHVALYLGDGYILHTASDYAVIEKMSSTRIKYFIEARRNIV